MRVRRTLRDRAIAVEGHARGGLITRCLFGASPPKAARHFFCCARCQYLRVRGVVRSCVRSNGRPCGLPHRAALGAPRAIAATTMAAVALAVPGCCAFGTIASVQEVPPFQHFEIGRELHIDRQILHGLDAMGCVGAVLMTVARFRRGFGISVRRARHVTILRSVSPWRSRRWWPHSARPKHSNGPLASLWVDPPVLSRRVKRPGQRPGFAAAAASIVTSRPPAAGCDAYAACVHAQGGMRRWCGTFPPRCARLPLMPSLAAFRVKGWLPEHKRLPPRTRVPLHLSLWLPRCARL